MYVYLSISIPLTAPHVTPQVTARVTPHMTQHMSHTTCMNTQHRRPPHHTHNMHEHTHTHTRFSRQICITVTGSISQERLLEQHYSYGYMIYPRRNQRRRSEDLFVSKSPWLKPFFARNPTMVIGSSRD